MYSPINGWTKAEIVAQIKAAVPRNGCAQPGTTNCAYRNARGKACAVGAFVPDDVYHPDMDYNTPLVSHVLETFPGLLSYMPLPTDALSRMQHLHDLHVQLREGGSVVKKLVELVGENVCDV